MTAPLDEARLRELAEAATPGPWTAFPYYYVTGDGERKRLVGSGPYDTVASIRMGHDDIPGSVDANAAFIAAANPTTILALLDTLSAERERADRAVGLLRRWRAVVAPSEALEDITDAFLATQKAEGA